MRTRIDIAVYAYLVYGYCVGCGCGERVGGVGAVLDQNDVRDRRAAIVFDSMDWSSRICNIQTINLLLVARWHVVATQRP